MKIDRAKAVRLHITQDSSGHWMQSFEMPDGKLYLTKFSIEHPEHEIEEAYHPERLERTTGFPRDIEIWISEKRTEPTVAKPAAGKPKPRRARKPYKVVRKGKDV